MRAILAAVLLFLSAALASAQDTPPQITLKGVVHAGDLHHYIELPFDVPSGTERLTVVFSQDGAADHTVIDLGLFDPERFRGWSGGARDGFTVANSDATPGYLPGPVVKGRWRLLLGVPNIRAGVTTHFVAKIFLGRAAVSRLVSMALRQGPGWYRGDLHMHTAHSDGKCRSRAGAMVPCPAFLTVDAADRRGLDFIVVTDHNTISQNNTLEELQPYFDKTLIIPGRELTTFQGHANALGGRAFIDFRLREGHPADALIDATHKAGALFSVNHASAPSGEICMGCGWTARLDHPGKVDAVEIVNGGSLRGTGKADGIGSGFALWQGLLDKGFHPTAIGGSDNHDGPMPLSETGSVGWPTTVVYAENLSEAAILAGIKSGHVFVDVEGTHDRSLAVTFEHAMMGDHVKAASEATLEVHVVGVPGGHIELVHDHALEVTSTPDAALRADDTLFVEIVPDGQRHWVYVKVTDEAGKLALVGNPIYFESSDRGDSNTSAFFR